ncbi:unnamed protein product [Strongylus vulgaris]|uniref:Cytochrome c oxidase assembly factor 6 homolog n=1 Tax=Strongylus vulgaris TaxID=40348 RepID=A0A3P7L5V9_STRVU|nr:unnamed protein product [Strongylus vulgaris]
MKVVETGEARDEFLACLDKGLDSGKTEEQARQECSSQLKAFEEVCPASWARQECGSQLKAFEEVCPASWVTRFVRQHSFQRYKQTLAEQGVNIADQNALGDEKN